MIKTVVEDCLSIDINKLKREGVLRVGTDATISWSGGSKIGILTYERESDYKLMVQLNFSCKGENVTQEFPPLGRTSITAANEPGLDARFTIAENYAIGASGSCTSPIMPSCSPAGIAGIYPTGQDRNGLILNTVCYSDG